MLVRQGGGIMPITDLCRLVTEAVPLSHSFPVNLRSLTRKPSYEAW